LQALHHYEGSSSIERGNLEGKRGIVEKRLLIDRQEAQLAVLGMQEGVLIYIQEKPPIRGYAYINIKHQTSVI